MASDDTQSVDLDARYELAPTRPEGWRGRLIPGRDTDVWDWPTTLDLSTPKGRALIIHATNPADVEFEKSDTVRFRACDFVIYPDELPNPQTGEVTQGCRVVLINAEGKTFKTTSEFVAHKLAQVLQLYTVAEWRAGIPFIITRRPSKRHPGGSYHQLEVEP
jgi:hypothetical protein